MLMYTNIEIDGNNLHYISNMSDKVNKILRETNEHKNKLLCTQTGHDLYTNLTNSLLSFTAELFHNKR